MQKPSDIGTGFGIIIGALVLVLPLTGCSQPKPEPLADVPSPPQQSVASASEAPLLPKGSPTPRLIRITPAPSATPVPLTGLDITIKGIETDQDKYEISKLLRNLAGVSDLEEISFNRTERMLKFKVYFRGQNTLFKERFFEAYRTSDRFLRLQETRSEGNTMEFYIP